VDSIEYPEPGRFSPDGLTEQVIDLLLREVDNAAGRPWSGPHSLDATSVQRRYRRWARRSVAAVVRALPVRRVATGPGGEAA
jgi:hypothetical protein